MSYRPCSAETGTYSIKVSDPDQPSWVSSSWVATTSVSEDLTYPYSKTFSFGVDITF